MGEIRRSSESGTRLPDEEGLLGRRERRDRPLVPSGNRRVVATTEHTGRRRECVPRRWVAPRRRRDPVAAAAFLEDNLYGRIAGSPGVGRRYSARHRRRLLIFQVEDKDTPGWGPR